MDLEIRQVHPGHFPKCGMALEPVHPTPDNAENPELADFRRRVWWTLLFTVVVVVLAMAGHPCRWFEASRQNWIELASATNE